MMMMLIIYINGIKVVDTGNACKKHVQVKLSEEVVASLKQGENLIARIIVTTVERMACWILVCW